jgi:hypothetical protein
LPTVRKTEIQDLSTQVRLTVWASLNDAAPSTSNRESVREISSPKKNPPLQPGREELDMREEKDEP